MTRLLLPVNPKKDNMTNEARAFLDQLDELCLKGDQTAADVMAVLTALRSHDVRGNTVLKSVTTVPIRRAALPRTAAALDADDQKRLQVGKRHNMNMKLDDPGDADRVDLRSLDLHGRSYARRSQTTDADQHFGQHAKAAGDALGLRVVL